MPVHHRLRFLTFPMRASRLCSLWPDMRPLRFRRVPFGRDVAFDAGGATASRIAMPSMLPSTVPSVSASAMLLISWLNPPPHRSLCTLRTRRRRRLRNTRFPAVRYHLTGAGLSPAGTRQLRLTHRNWKFESISLQRTVRVSRDIPLLRRKAGLFPRVCGAEQVARSGETGVARSHGADRRQYLCRAKFQYRGVDGGDGSMRRIGQRPSRARYADCARQAVDVRVGSIKSRAM
jgi:hypothetical protein